MRCDFDQSGTATSSDRIPDEIKDALLVWRESF